MYSQFISMQAGEQASFCWRENGKCEGRDEGDECPPGPWGYPNGVIHHHSQSHAEQSCQCMNAALLLSAILIMAAVTALINTITSHWKSLWKNLSRGAVYQELYTTPAVSYAEGAAGWMAATVLRGCDFVAHHCPCLTAAWLLLRSCCDIAKCCLYERAKRVYLTVNNFLLH